MNRLQATRRVLWAYSIGMAYISIMLILSLYALQHTTCSKVPFAGFVPNHVFVHAFNPLSWGNLTAYAQAQCNAWNAYISNSTEFPAAGPGLRPNASQK